MKKLTKRAKIKNLWFDVPMFTSHVVVNGNGSVWAINIIAACNLNLDSNDWRFPITDGGEYAHVGSVDLEGADWRRYCFYVGDQRFGEEVERQECITSLLSKFREIENNWFNQDDEYYLGHQTGWNECLQSIRSVSTEE